MRLSWFIAGIVCGDLFWFGLVVSGLTVLAHNFYYLFAAIKYVGAAYLLYLAWKLWRAPAWTVMATLLPVAVTAVPSSSLRSGL